MLLGDLVNYGYIWRIWSGDPNIWGASLTDHHKWRKGDQKWNGWTVFFLSFFAFPLSEGIKNTNSTRVKS